MSERHLAPTRGRNIRELRNVIERLVIVSSGASSRRTIAEHMFRHQ
ncbi:MAG: hypothetical protein ACLRWP_13040 [Bilophila wadsworthia]